MQANPSPVQITADGLIVLRADTTLMRDVGAQDPYAQWFVTEEGRQMASLALASDPVFAVFNLARYRWFSERLAKAAEDFCQIVILGSGYDTRPLWMAPFNNGRSKVFTIDVTTTLSVRDEVLRSHGVMPAPWVVPVSCDLDSGNLRGALELEGFRADRPSFVMAEGLFYYLSASTIMNVLTPMGMGLAPGSVFLFDFWADARVQRLNDHVFERRGIRMFKSFPLPQRKDALEPALTDLGYGNVDIASLEEVARRYWPASYHWPSESDWYLVAMSLGDTRFR